MEYRLARTNEDKGYKIIDTFEENGKLYANCKLECPRCGGAGQIPYFGHVDQGVCFKCAGKKYFYNTFRAYTEEERQKMDAAYEKKKAREEEKAKAESEVNKKAWMEKYGFTENIYIVAGCNTYKYKDILKEAGARFFSGINWFFNDNTVKDELNIDDPNAFLYHCTFDDIFDWNYHFKRANFKDGALIAINEEINRIKYSKNKTTSKSEFYGEIGERIRKTSAKFISVRCVANDWGNYFLYTFEIEDNVFIWFSQAVIDSKIKEGDTIILSGTVKDHKEYNGIKQTYLSRCIVKPAE